MAGRNVGSIELTVNADTGRLVATVSKGGAQAGKAGARAIDDALNEIGGAGLGARLKVVRQKIEASFQNLDIDLEVDQGRVRRDLKQIQSLLAATRLELEINPDFDFASVGDDILALQQLIGDIDVSVDAEVDEAELLAVRAEIEAIFRDIRVEVDVDLDDTDLLTEKARLKAMGEDAGGEFGDGIGIGLGGRTAKIVAAVAAVFEPALAGLTGLVSAATAIVGSATLGLVAGSAALAATLAGTLNLFGGAAIGAQGFGDAMGAINEEMAAATAEGRDFNAQAEDIQAALVGLSPNARRAAVAFGDLRTELSDAQSEIQEELFAGVSAELASLSGTVIPDVTGAFKIGARQANEFGKGLAEIARQTDFTDIFTDLAPTMDNIVDAGLALIATLEPFLRAAAPAAELLSESFRDSAESLRQLTITGNDTGTLSDFLVDGVESLREFGQLAIALTQALGTLFSAGQEQGDSFVQSLTDAIDRWDAWMNSIEGQASLDEFFEKGSTTLEAFKPLLDGVVEAYRNLSGAGAEDSFAQLAESIGKALPVLADLLSIIGEAGLFTAIGNLLAAFGPLVELFTLIPGEILVTITTFGLMIAVALKVRSAIIAAQTAFVALQGSLLLNPVFLGVAAAAAVAVTAFALFSDSSNDTAARTAELSSALDGTVEALLRESDASDRARLGIEALGKTLVESGDSGDELTKALGRVGLTGEDAVDTLLALREGPVDALADLARGVDELDDSYSLSGEAARAFAELVNGSDFDFEGAGVLSLELKDLAATYGLTNEQALGLASAIQNVQDQANETDLGDVAKQQLELALGSDAATRAIAEQVLAGRNLADLTEGELVYAFNSYVTATADAEQATRDAAEALREGLTDTYSANDAINEAIEAREAEAQALIDAGRAAYDAAADEDRLARATRDAVTELLAASGVTGDVVDDFINLGAAAETASGQAAALDSALNILFGRAASSEEAFDQALTGIRELVEVFEDGSTNAGKFTGDIFGLSEEAVLLREELRGSADGLLTYATAALEAGESNSVVASNVNALRGLLVEQATQLLGTEEAANAYIDTLIGTPEALTTLIETPGLVDALLGAENLNLLYDAAGNPVISEFEAIGLDATTIDAEGLKTLIQEIDGSAANVTVTGETTVPTTEDIDAATAAAETADSTSADIVIESSTVDGTQVDVDNLIETIGDLDALVPKVVVELPNIAVRNTEVDLLIADIKTLDALIPSVTITLPGIDSRITEVNNLKASIDRLQSKTITITTNQRTGNIDGNMTGNIITTPTISHIAERGMAEAIIPLQLPLSRVNPNVREMAALIRSGGASGASATQAPAAASGPRTVNHNKFIITETDRSETTARRVMNRLVTLV